MNSASSVRLLILPASIKSENKTSSAPQAQRTLNERRVMALPSAPEQLADPGWECSPACLSRRKPSANVNRIPEIDDPISVPDVGARFSRRPLGASSAKKVKTRGGGLDCNKETYLSPVGQPTHHTRHGKENREEIEGETLWSIKRPV